MAQVGSAIVIAVKAVRASSYQNECSSATARWKSAWAVGEQEIGKWTLPSVSPSCAAAASGSASIRTSATISRCACMARVLLSVVDDRAPGGRRAAGRSVTRHDRRTRRRLKDQKMDLRGRRPRRGRFATAAEDARSPLEERRVRYGVAPPPRVQHARHLEERGRGQEGGRE